MLISHSLQIATRGIIGSTIAIPTAGYIIQVEEISFPDTPSFGFGGSSYRHSKDEPKKEEKKCIRITVFYAGKKHVSEHCIDRDLVLTMKDIDITHDEEKILSVEIKNINKT